MDRIGRYQILGELGRGAMGVVYRALDPAIGRTVAIKTIRLSDVADQNERASLKDRLFREAQAAGNLSHPNIVTIYDVGQEGDLAYIALEWVDGPTLDRQLAEEAPDAKFVMNVLSQTATALDYAHKRGIVHRDVKPANIIMHERTTVKIADFGIAKIQSHQMTQGGAMLGTPNYMSPEQVQGLPVDGRADQYSLAVIAYELLTGEKPFNADSMPALVFKIVREEPIPPQRLNRTLEWPVETVLKRALSKTPEERYPSCSDFVFALENACRASKNWRPNAPGAALNLPTIIPAAARTPSQPVGHRRPVTNGRPIISTPDDVPKWVRVARTLAVVIVSAGLVAAGMVGALRYLSPEEAKIPPPPVEDQTQIPEQKRPSPLADPAREPSLPGDSPQQQAQPRPSEQAQTTSPHPPEVEDLTRDNAPQRMAAPKPAGDAPVRLATYPPGAHIVLDSNSELACDSPCSLILPPGRHTLAATLDGHRRTLKIFEMPKDAELLLSLERTTGTLMLRSEPRGAFILVNGDLRPEKTPAMITLPTGKYTVEIVKDSNRETQEVIVKESVIVNVSVDWSRNSNQ